MRKIGLLCFLLLAWVTQGFGVPQNLTLPEIPKVLERLFSYHIENKQLNTTIIRRSMKIFIEQFDSEKAYLLNSEVNGYLHLTDEQASAILQRVQKGNYSDYTALIRVFQGAIARAGLLRATSAQELIQKGVHPAVERSVTPSSQYAATESDLRVRQASRMVRFFLFHESRTSLETPERRAKVCSLFERKVGRLELPFLASNPKFEHMLTVKILKSLAKSLDTHTSFFSPEEAYEMRLSLEKQFEGVGVVLAEGVDGVLISDVIKGSPAEQSGKIEVNDLLLSIDDQDIRALSFEEVLDLLKKKGSEVLLGFKRNAVSFAVSLKKQPIVMNEERIEVSHEKFGDGIVGKIALHSFYESANGVSSEKDMKEAIRSFKGQGPLHGLILDLRENSGGFLSQAVKVAGLFISTGVVVISKYGKEDVHYLRTLGGRAFFSGPVVVLTSKMSASAAEIVAQALQDYGIAVIVGDERTFGKGSIQYQNVTDAKSDLFFKVTVGRYYTASGRSTQIDGVIADVVVPTQYAPYNIGERFLEYPLPRDAVAPAFVDPLTDLDEKTRQVFQKRYLPFLQRVVPYWKKILSQLKKNSEARLARDPDFQAFLKRLDKVRARQHALPVNTIDEHIRIGMEDLQMKEAVNVLKDMILIESEGREGHQTALAPTGSD
ncbi:MAG TPA: S41 family peptidase [Chlamydiales bacterium]|jgi:carboxyl-terminal processing protease